MRTVLSIIGKSLPCVGKVYLIIVFASNRVPISVEQIGPRKGVNVQSQS
jgi:hypothetical protein